MSDDSGKGDDSGKLLYCSFCGKSQHEGIKLIAGLQSLFATNVLSYVTTLFREVAEAAESTESSKLLCQPRLIGFWTSMLLAKPAKKVLVRCGIQPL